VTSSASISVAARDTLRRAPFRNAPPPRGREQLVAHRVVHRADFEYTVHFEREARTEDRQAVGEVRRAVDRIAHPNRARGRRGAAQLLAKHGVRRMALGDERANHPLDGDVHLGDQVDRALLVDAKRAAEGVALKLPGAAD